MKNLCFVVCGRGSEMLCSQIYSMCENKYLNFCWTYSVILQQNSIQLDRNKISEMKHRNPYMKIQAKQLRNALLNLGDKKEAKYSNMQLLPLVIMISLEIFFFIVSQFKHIFNMNFIMLLLDGMSLQKCSIQTHLCISHVNNVH